MAETDFARHLTAFLSRYLPGQRNLSVNTIMSYRDAFKLFLSFCESEKGRKAETLRMSDLSSELVTDYFSWLEKERHCAIATRNQRLAAFKSFFHYVAAQELEHLLLCQKLLGIPMKRHSRELISFFSPEDLHLLLSQPDTTTWRGRRDHALLVLLYDTAARVQELVDLRIRDLRFEKPATITLHGKGRKIRVVPIGARTAAIMESYFRERDWIGKTSILDLPVFTNGRKSSLTRAGVAYILSKYVHAMCDRDDWHAPPHVSPHSLRHSKAVHLLRSGVPLIYIRDFLGHVSVTTTEIYAKVDEEERRKAIEGAYEVPAQESIPDWQHDKGLISWLSDLCR
jgi:site-specific recombinase XerD